MGTKEHLMQLKNKIQKDTKNFVTGIALVTGLTGVPTGVSAQTTHNNTDNEATKEVVSKAPYDYQSSIREVRHHIMPQMSETTADKKLQTGFNNKGEEISCSAIDVELAPGSKASGFLIKEGDMYYISHKDYTFSYNKETNKVGCTVNHDTSVKGQGYLHYDKKGNLDRFDNGVISLYGENHEDYGYVSNWDVLIDKAVKQHDTKVKEARENGKLQPIPNAKNRTLMYQAAQNSR